MKGLRVLRDHVAQERTRLAKLRSARRIHDTADSIVLQNRLEAALMQAEGCAKALLIYEVGREEVHNAE